MVGVVEKGRDSLLEALGQDWYLNVKDLELDPDWIQGVLRGANLIQGASGQG